MILFIWCALLLTSNIFQIEASGLLLKEKPSKPSTTFQQLLVGHLSERIEFNIKEDTVQIQCTDVFHHLQRHEADLTYAVPIISAEFTSLELRIDDKRVQPQVLVQAEAMEYWMAWSKASGDPSFLHFIGNPVILFELKNFPAQQSATFSLSYQYLLSNNSIQSYLYLFNNPLNGQREVDHISFQSNISQSRKIKNIYSPFIQMDILKKDDHNAELKFTSSGNLPSNNLDLSVQLSEADIAHQLLTFPTGQDEGIFYINFTPSLNSEQLKVVDKDVTFIIDCSGSMAGEKMAQARKAIKYCVNNLNGHDRFNIVKFANKAEILFKNRTASTDKSLYQARRFINGFKGSGGTNMEDAFYLAFEEDAPADRPHMIIFLTDGQPTVATTHEEPLLQILQRLNPTNRKIFTVGIGEEISTHLLDKINEMTNSTGIYIEPHEDIEVKVTHFYNRVSSPVLTNPEMSFSKNVQIQEVFPAILPDLYSGGSINVFGRYEGHGAVSIQLSGYHLDSLIHFNFSDAIDQNERNNDFLPALWASRSVGQKINQIRLFADEFTSVSLRKQIIELARTYGILSPTTAFLLFTDEEAKLNAGVIPKQKLVFNTGKNKGRFKKQIAEEYLQEIKSSTGKEGIASSEVVKKLFDALHLDDHRSDIAVTDRKGRSIKLSDGVLYHKGRAFYLGEKGWLDALYLNAEYPKSIGLTWGANQYWEWLKAHPHLASTLAISKNIRFIEDGQLILVED